jgi:hypothetical protein
MPRENLFDHGHAHGPLPALCDASLYTAAF